MSKEVKGPEKGSEGKEMLVIESSRFGPLEVAAETVIKIPQGLIGFSQDQSFIMLEHKPPFSWLQSIGDPNLAFVVVDGFEFGQQYKLQVPVGDPVIDLKEDDEYAILVIVTVRPDPRETTANLKAPIFVNLRNRLGIQLIYDNPSLSTRFPLWSAQEETAGKDSSESKKK